MLANLMIVGSFDYTHSTTESNIEVMYEATSRSNITDWQMGATVALCILAVTYLGFLTIAWWIERRGMIPQFRPFSYLSFGANAKDVSPGRFLAIICLVVILVVLVLIGQLHKWVIDIFKRALDYM